MTGLNKVCDEQFPVRKAASQEVCCAHGDMTAYYYNSFIPLPTDYVQEEEQETYGFGTAPSDGPEVEDIDRWGARGCVWG